MKILIWVILTLAPSIAFSQEPCKIFVNSHDIVFPTHLFEKGEVFKITGVTSDDSGQTVYIKQLIATENIVNHMKQSSDFDYLFSIIKW